MRSNLGKIAALIMVLAAMATAETLDTAALMKKVYNFRGGVNFNYGGAGFHAGVMVDHPLTLIDIAEEAYLMEFHYGAQFVRKSWRWYRSAAYYIEVPVLFSMKKKFSESVSARVDFGPYFDFGLFGTNDIFDYYDRFDAGLIYGATMDFAKKYSIAMHMGTGFWGGYYRYYDFYSVYMTIGYKL